MRKSLLVNSRLLYSKAINRSEEQTVKVNQLPSPLFLRSSCLYKPAFALLASHLTTTQPPTFIYTSNKHPNQPPTQLLAMSQPTTTKAPSQAQVSPELQIIIDNTFEHYYNAFLIFQDEEPESDPPNSPLCEEAIGYHSSELMAYLNSHL